MKQLLLRWPLPEEHDRVPQVERRVQGPAILGSTQSASTPRVTFSRVNLVPAPRSSCGGTPVLCRGDSAIGSP